jgi:hypothetical protein
VTRMPQPPVPSDDPSADSVRLVDPDSGEPVPTADLRRQFARRPGAGDPEAEQAFVDSKLELIRTHPTLSEAERQAAVAEVLHKVHGPGSEDPSTGDRDAHDGG